jgi:flagellar biosynthetic protein FlhB
VVKSVEVNAAAVLLASIYFIRANGDGFVTSWSEFTTKHLMQVGSFDLTLDTLPLILRTAGELFLRLVLPLLGAVMVAGVSTNLAQSGLVFAAQSMQFDFARLNPLQGLTRMFSQRAAVDMGKSILKAGIVGYVIYGFFRDRSGDIVQLITIDPAQIGPELFRLALDLLLKTAMMLSGIAAVDYMYQRWQFEKSLRMTKQEVKEEFKRTEGDPLVKSYIRQRQREFMRRRMMSDVAQATVVITNPTHLAVALRYDPGQMPAPRVVAKGQRLMAERIKDMARQHGVPVIENKPLARSLYAQCDIGQLIPAELYQVVAEVLAFVFRQSGRVQL